MLIETRPIMPARTGHARSWIATLAPLILLVIVVAVAIAGPQRPTTPASDPLGLVAGATDDAADAAASEPATTTPPARGATVADIAFPTRIYDLPVQTVAEALTEGDAEAIVAIQAWLTIRYDDGCARSPLLADGRVVPDALCWRNVILGGDASPAFAWQDGAMRRIGPNGAHLHAQIPPGVDREYVDREAIPMFGGGRRAGTIEPIPVVVVGRFGDSRVPECTSNGRHCGESFVIERVSWVAGAYPPEPVVTFVPMTASSMEPDVVRASAAQGFSGPTVVLSQSLLSVEDLVGIDPAAADVVAADLAAAVTASVERLWFVRVLAPGGPDGPARTIRWLAIDDTTGAIITTGPSN